MDLFEHLESLAGGPPTTMGGPPMTMSCAETGCGGFITLASFIDGVPGIEIG